MKPIFLRFIQDDSIPSANELVHLQSENVKLIHRISEKEDEIRKIGNELKTERSKNTRLENRVEKLLAQLKEHENLEEIPKVKRQGNAIYLNRFLFSMLTYEKHC